jgi:hypothetical protein
LELTEEEAEALSSLLHSVINHQAVQQVIIDNEEDFGDDPTIFFHIKRINEAF